tara:strand:+ start:91 stop:432 length:342 start_codon:yes stop_codon:yes gene_type:complete
MKSKVLKGDKKMMNKLKDNLASIAALIAAVVAIGGGFVKYGEITTKLSQIEASQGVDFTPLEKRIDGNAKSAKENKDNISSTNTKAEVNSREIELLKLQIKEIQIKSSNPLGG